MMSRLTTIFQTSLAALGLAVFLASQGLAGDPQYLAAVADLPLAPGLVEEIDAGISFDKPEGRIVVAVARGDATLSDVVAFYSAALPALGWLKLDEAEAGSRWRRDDEILSLDIVDGGQPLVVRFSIAPN